MQHHDEGLDHFGAKCHFLPLLTIHPFSTAASRTLRVAWVLGFYPSSTYHQGHADSQTNIHAHTHSQQPISRSTFLVYWQVTDACEDNAEQLFCRLSDTVSQKIIGWQKAGSRFPGTFLCLYPMFCVWRSWASGTENIPPKTTFQSEVNVAGSVCDSSRHYTGLLVCLFFLIWRYFKVVTQWGPGGGGGAESSLGWMEMSKSKRKWNELDEHVTDLVGLWQSLLRVRVSWWPNATQLSFQ